ncbi:MAG: UDP-N-acetylmuramoyl-L-alanine--D-glutamate ligase [Armatimonadota bacterium]
MELELRGRKIAVIGLARTGTAVVPVLVRRGADVVVYDTKPRQELIEQVQALQDWPVDLVLGRDDYPGIERSELVIPSPGVPADAPVLTRVRRAGAAVLPEIELGYLLSKAPIVAVTGTNGKTTTALLIADMLRRSGVNALVGGNLAPGEPLVTLADRAGPTDVIVAEVSSFQLETCKQFHPRVAVLTNISEDHLNRHRSMQEYADAKARIFEAQDEGDLAVLNAECLACVGMADRVRARLVWFSSRRRVGAGAWLDGRTIVVDLGVPLNVGDVREMRIFGSHNVENALAAATAAVFMGATPGGIRQTLRHFPGVPHRMEPVGTSRGVLYVNNSMCTNPQALLRSVEGCPKPVVLIAGGRNKNLDFSGVMGRLATQIKAAVLMGEMASELAELLQREGLQRVATAANMEAAVSTAAEMAQPGDVVLLAPGCASMDMYSDFMERGDAFRSAVLSLPECTPVRDG